LSTALSEHVLHIAGRDMPLAVLRHPRARRLKLRYDPRGGLLKLTLPPRGDLGSALRWAGEQGDWVARQLASSDERGMMPVEPGTVLPFGDGVLQIAWQASAPRTPRIAEDQLRVGGPEVAIGRRIARWLAAEARTQFSAATAALAAGADLPLAGVSVGDPKSRWGSCSAAKHIRYSWRLMLAPRFVQDSVVAHEVAHLAHMNHSPRFHRLAEELLGTDPAPARDWLRRHGGDLQRWDFS
jgi:predicted metal-dependent hydrolase